MAYSRKNNKKKTQRVKTSCVGLSEQDCVFPCRTVKKKHMEIYGHCRKQYDKNKYHLDESSKHQIEKLLLNLKQIAKEGDKIHNHVRGLEKRVDEQIQKSEKLTKVATKVKESAMAMKDSAAEMKKEADKKNASVVGMATNLISNIGSMVTPEKKQEASKEPVQEEETPVEDAPVVDEAPVEEAPVDEAPVAEEETPVVEEEAQVDEAPVQETPVVDEAPVEETPIVDEAPVEETPVVDEAPVVQNTEEQKPTIVDQVSNFFTPPKPETEVKEGEKQGGKRRKRRSKSRSRSNKKRI